MFIRVSSVLVAIIATTLFPLAPAKAWVNWNCKWSTSNIDYWNNGSSANFANINNAAGDWNARVGPANLARTTTYTSRDFEVYDANAGNVSWSGITRKPATSLKPGCTSAGFWIARQMEVVYNTFYYSTASSWRRGVLVHEYGHALGLWHNQATQTCPFSGIKYTAIMYSSDNRMTGDCAIFVPQSDDILGVNTLY